MLPNQTKLGPKDIGHATNIRFKFPIDMKDYLKTIIVAIIAIIAYLYRSEISLLDERLFKSESAQNKELISKFGDYYEEDGGITYQNPKHKPRKFYHDDYAKYFNVYVVHELKTDDSIKDLLDAHDIYTDLHYLNNQEFYDEMANIYGLYIEHGGEDDGRSYVSFVGPQKGYGAFAAVDILKGAYIGEYTGVLTNKTSNTDYAWNVGFILTYNST